MQTSDKLSFASFFVQGGTVTQILKPADLKTAGRMLCADGGLAGMHPTSTCLNDHKKANSSAVDFFFLTPEVSIERVLWCSPDLSPSCLWDSHPSSDELTDVPTKPQG